MGKPTIRFEGYTDDWEQRKLGDVIEKLTGGASIAPDDYVDVGYRTIPKGAVNSSGVADMSGCKIVSENFFKKNISSKISSGELVTSLRDLVPTAPNMGRIVRICGETEDFLMPQGVYSIIVKERISEDFLITYSNSPEYRKIIMAEKNGSTQVHIRNGEFLNIDIPLPSHEEQRKIGEYFKTLDHLITLHQRKCEETKKLKKFMLQKIFPQKGEKVPEIRFSGFTADWEQRKVGELLEERNEQAPMSADYPLMAFIANHGVAPKGERYDRSALVNDETGKKYKRTEFGDFIYSSNNLETGSIGLNKYGNACISPVYSIFKSTGKAELDFLGRRFLKKDFINEMVKWRQGVVYGQWKIHETDFMKIQVTIPNMEEQKEIGQYFDHLDHLITLHQHKCEELQNIKKFMLQNMFI